MRTASVLFSLLGFALGLWVLTTDVAPYVFNPQLANLAATNPGVYGLTPGIGTFLLAFVGYPLCLIGAGFAFGAASKRHRTGLAVAPIVISVLGMLTGCPGAFSSKLGATAVMLMSITVAIPLASVVVVAILTFRPVPVTKPALPASPGLSSDGPHQPTGSS